MRILGFSKKWDKLNLDKPLGGRPSFTTFRFPRKDKDWEVGEQVKITFKPRRKGGGEILGIAEIVSKELKRISEITEQEAVADGFGSAFNMHLWLKEVYKHKSQTLPRMNKLTLRWAKG